MLKFLIVVIFLAWILWLFYTSFDEAFGPDGDPANQAAAVVCSEDVGFCDDGTTVVREGPNCTFETCPE